MIQASLIQPVHWRTRLVYLRGILATTLGLVLTASHLHFHTPFGSWLGPAFLLLMLSPSLIYLLTRGLSRRGHHEIRWLGIELALDVVAFVVLLYLLGGSSNPLAFYLLVPILIAALALPPVLAIVLCLLAITGYSLTGFFYLTPMEHTDLHALSHQMSQTHSLGMWLIFVIIASVLTLLGQLIQQAVSQTARQQANALNLSLQRERMYQIASVYADQAHEINTPLNTLLLLIDALRHSESEQERTDTLAQLEHLARHLGGKLRTLSRHEHSNAPTTLEQLVEDTARQLRHLCPQMKTRFKGHLNPTLNNPSDWQRILLNLGYNAIDAGATAFNIYCDSRSESGEDTLQVCCQDNGAHHPPRKAGEGLGIGLILVDTTVSTLPGEWHIINHHGWTRVTINSRIPVSLPPENTAPTDEKPVIAGR